MPVPIALCLERLDPREPEDQFIRCVAVSGAESGLGLRADGGIVWKTKTDLACELWVSADERLILLRPEGAVPVRVSRAGRHLDAPVGKPVILLDQDEVRLPDRQYRIHVHGPAEVVHPPTPLLERARAGVAAIAAVAMMGAMTSGCPDKQIEVRDQPPAVMPLDPPDAEIEPPSPGDAAPDGESAASLDAGSKEVTAIASASAAPPPPPPAKVEPIRVRDAPPKPVNPRK